MNKLWDFNLVIDVSEEIARYRANARCEHCGQNPCICGSHSETQNPHKNLEKLAQKILPLVNEINEELERHAKHCKKMMGDEEAGYPPKCNTGYEVKDGKCVKIKEDTAKKNGSDKKKEDKKKDEKKDKGDKGDKGDKKEDGKNLPPWLKKKKGEAAHNKKTYADLWNELNNE